MAKSNKKSTPAQAPSVPVAPSNPLGVGVQTKGGHYIAYKAQGNFALSDHLTFAPGFVNWWRPTCPGGKFFAAVLQPALESGISVSDAIAAGNATLGLKPQAVQQHLKWLYTWGNGMSVNGVAWGSTQA